MSLLDAYARDIASGVIERDTRQVEALNALEQIRKQALQPVSFWQRLTKQVHAIKGLYLWGGVGIGKTYMMDLFCHELNSDRVRRMHFHTFMQQVHAELRVREGEAEPLTKIAKQFAAKTRIICFDEFFVSDITDAMILATLFQALFEQGVTLVATSNVEPDQLYRSGLQRSRFLPAIELIKTHCDVMHLEITTDYRLQKLRETGVFFESISAESDQKLAHVYRTLTTEHEQIEAPLEIDGRLIEVVKRTEHVAWFDFSVICNQPRSQMDYLAIADEYDTVIVSHVPQIGKDETDKITYWIYLIDILYDKRVKLILSSAVPIEDIYREGRKVFEYQRTLSRLQEMQSEQYLHEAHQSTLT